MYDLDDPVSFVQAVSENLVADGIFCFEVMYLPAILDNLAFDTFLAEHLTHWSLFTIETLLKKAGMKVVDCYETPVNGGSILVFAANEHCSKYDSSERKERILDLKKKEFDKELDDESTYVIFREKFNRHKEEITKVLDGLLSEGKKIGLYGVSTKANVIIQGENLEKYFSFGIERSEEKVGGQTLWGLPIISEEQARKEADENTVWILGPYFFLNSMMTREQEFLDKGGTIVVPLPAIQIIKK
jgi:hypothetical protein